MNDWKGDRITFCVDYDYIHFNYKEDDRNWLLIKDYRNKEMILNIASLKTVLDQANKEYIDIKDYERNERKIKLTHSDINRQFDFIDINKHTKSELGVETVSDKKLISNTEENEVSETIDDIEIVKPDIKLLKSSMAHKPLNKHQTKDINGNECFASIETIHKYIFLLYQQ